MKDLPPGYGPSPVPGGPPIRVVDPCIREPSQHCKWDNHNLCAHNPGGCQETGVAVPDGYLTRRDSTVISDNATGWAVQILPMHLWHCGCPHHQTILTLF